MYVDYIIYYSVVGFVYVAKINYYEVPSIRKSFSGYKMSVFFQDIVGLKVDAKKKIVKVVYADREIESRVSELLKRNRKLTYELLFYIIKLVQAWEYVKEILER